MMDLKGKGNVKFPREVQEEMENTPSYKSLKKRRKLLSAAASVAKTAKVYPIQLSSMLRK